MNWDLFLGPAPMRPFNELRFKYNWHWFWDTGNGDLGNQGIHEVDIARWGLGVTHPTKVSTIGGKFMFDDDQETPNTMTASFEFDEGGKKKMLVFEVRHWMSNGEAGIVSRGGPGSNPDVVGNIATEQVLAALGKAGADAGIDNAKLTKVLGMANEIRAKYAHASVVN